MSAFDDIIRAKLAAATHEGQPDWDRLRQHLDGDAFDAALSDTLAGVTASAMADAPPPDWSALADRLDRETALAEDAFDQLISRRLAGATADVPPAASWRQLSHRMDTLWLLRRRLVRYRVLELAAAAALVLTFVPLLRDNPVWQSAATAEAVAVAPPSSPGADADAVEAEVYSPLDNLASALGLGTSVAAELATEEELRAYYEPLSLRPRPITAVAPTVLEFNPGLVDFPDVVGAAAQGKPSGTFAVVDQGGTASVRRFDGPFGQLADLGLHPVSLAPAIPNIALSTPIAKGWSFGAAAGWKSWRVYTPTDQNFDRSSQVKSVEASQISAHVLRRVAPRVRLGVSAALSSATYDTGLPEVSVASSFFDSGFDVSEEFESIDLDISQAVADVRVDLLPARSPVRLWGKLGVGGNFFLRNDYEVYRNIGDPLPPVEARPMIGAEVLEVPVEQELPLTALKDFSKGILEGGSLRQNVQAFGRLGIEAEIALGDRIRAFGGVDADLLLPGQRGFGPNRDEFNALGIEFGARVSL